MSGDNPTNVVEKARSYYNSSDADTFYFTVWGGEDIHIGLYKDDREPIFDASRRTVETMHATKKGPTWAMAMSVSGAPSSRPRSASPASPVALACVSERHP